MASRLSRTRSSIGLAVLTLALAAPAAALPVDLGDPSLRTILVELESSPCDPIAGVEADCRIFANDPGAVFGTVLSATFEIVAGEAIVTIAAADWEPILFTQQGQGTVAPNTPGILAGNTSDAVLRFDVATGMPTAWDWTSLIHVTLFGLWFQIPLTNAIAPSPNDVYFTNFFGNPLALNCVGTGGPAPTPANCTGPPLTHQAYDPLTGTITALAGVANGLVREVWGPADWRLSEVPEPRALALFGSGALGLALLGRRPRGA